MKREETNALHGPWPDDDPDDHALFELRRDHPEWRIWRAISENLDAGDWCAQHIDTGERVHAATGDELRRRLGVR